MNRAAIQRHRPPQPDTVRLWTIQPPYVWDALQEKGVLLVDPTHPNFCGIDLEAGFSVAYEWLRTQMAKRIPAYAGNFPWWAYDHFLDLRFYRWHHGKQGERLVRIELAVPKEKVLLSAYEDWHCVLNRYYLPEALDSEARDRESDAWEAEAYGDIPLLEQNWVRLAKPWKTQLQESWERIFDVDARRPSNTIQANFERLELADVVKVTKFTAVESTKY